MNYQQWFEENKKYIHGADVDAWCETAFKAGEKAALSQPVSMEPSVWVDHDTGAVSFTKPLRPTYVNYFNESQLAAARQQGAEEVQPHALKEKLRSAEQRIAELEKPNAVLLEALKEAEYALDYAADMTKPEGLSGCDCPICSVAIKVRAAIQAAEVKP